MYRGSVVVIENSLRTHKVPQLRFACARCARAEPGVVCRPFASSSGPPFLRSCDCTSKRAGGSEPLFYCKWLIRKHFILACLPQQSECGVGRQPMPDYSYILFNKTPLQLRSLGARGGRPFGRNQRARRARLAAMPTPPQTAPLCAAPGPTTADAIALLDAQFPWLRSAEERLSSKRQNPR